MITGATNVEEKLGMITGERKKKKKRKSATNVEEKLGIDRLPDDVVIRILSFMDTRTAVQTSVLSKRWIFLWRDIRALNFDEWCTPGGRKSFRNLVQSFFERHNMLSAVQSLSLRNVLRLDRHVAGSLKFMSTRRPQQVDRLEPYAVWNPFAYIAQNYHLAFKCLRTLKVENCCIAPNCLNLPLLTTLRLEYVQLEKNQHNPIDADMFSSLSSLENLALINCDVEWSGSGHFIISCPKLLTLELSDFRVFSQPTKVMVSAEALTTLNLEITNLTRFHLLIDRAIRLHTVILHADYEIGRDWNLSYLTHLFQALRAAKSLYISTGTIKVLSLHMESLKYQNCPFDNLEILKLEKGSSDENLSSSHEVEHYFLSDSPKLKEIVPIYGLSTSALNLRMLPCSNHPRAQFRPSIDPTKELTFTAKVMAKLYFNDFMAFTRSLDFYIDGEITKSNFQYRAHQLLGRYPVLMDEFNAFLAGLQNNGQVPI